MNERVRGAAVGCMGTMDCGSVTLADIDAFLAASADIRHDSDPVRGAHAVEVLAGQWHALNLPAGALVLLAMPNSVRLLAHCFAVSAAGYVPALIPPNTPSLRLRELMAALGARALGALRLPRGMDFGRRHDVSGLAVGRFETDGPVRTRPGEHVLLTSGTSGFASGCVFDRGALLRNAARHAASIGQTGPDTVLVNLPLHFSFALVAQALATLQAGGRLIIGGPPFHPRSYMRSIADHGVTLSSLTPVLVRALLHEKRAFPASLRILTVGGDSLPADQVRALLAARPGGALYLTYGLTQAGPRVSTLAAHREPAARHGSVGLPLRDTEAVLAPVPGGRELLVRSDTLMKRRIGAPEGASRRVDLDRDGRDAGTAFLRTGDLFEQDGDGYLYFRGRLSDFVVHRGEKVCLASVRRIAAELPRVHSAATRVSTDRAGNTCFALTLYVAKTQHPGVEAYRARLGRLLRRNEMPDRIEVTANADQHK
ncbi:MAG: acyl--CoA ligase [Lentisphaerae bacterium]|nr:acyl--CoA ligase [Lentisphaerota bacterium]